MSYNLGMAVGDTATTTRPRLLGMALHDDGDEALYYLVTDRGVYDMVLQFGLQPRDALPEGTREILPEGWAGDSIVDVLEGPTVLLKSGRAIDVFPHPAFDDEGEVIGGYVEAEFLSEDEVGGAHAGEGLSPRVAWPFGAGAPG